MSTGPTPEPRIHPESPPSTHARRPGSRQWLPLIIVVALAIAIVVPPLFNIERYQHRIAANISRSLGRPVHFAHLSLRLLPRPGFELTEFTVEEGPGFGAEPILHSSTVIASIRLLSLWRGRLEIARIALEEPSLNLVRNPSGKWNFASVVTQASTSTIAPTGQLRPTRTLRFPYIEATNARINFKYGDEKQPFSFMNGDLSLWLENPEEWQLRFAAQPVRTDLDLFASNTGLLRIEGSMKRAPALGELPLNLRTEWTRAPLGQISRLFGQQDPGWRGDVDLRTRITGTPSELLLNSSVKLSDLHRVEFQPEHTLTYAAHCTGTFKKVAEAIHDLDCSVPIGTGQLRLTGIVRPPAQPEGTLLDFDLLNLPAVAALDFLRLTREQLGTDFAVAGDLNGHFTLAATQRRTTLSGSATAARLTMTSPYFESPLGLANLRLTALDTLPAPAIGKGTNRRAPISAPTTLLLSPVKIDFGAPAPLLVDGRFDRQGFVLHFGGRAELTRLIPAVRSIGVADPGLKALQPTGDATLDIQLRGPWLAQLDPENSQADSIAGAPTGTITLRNAQLTTSYLPAPLLIKSAEGSLLRPKSAGSSTQIAWSNIVAQYGPVHFTGSFRASLPCAAATATTMATDDCTRQFDITLPTLDLGALSSVLIGNDPLMKVLLSHIERSPSGPDWPPMHGTVRAAIASLGTLQMTDAVASLDIKGARVTIESLDARSFEGSLHLSGTLDAGVSPAYRLDAQLNQASIAALGQLFHQAWGTGAINVATHLALNGLTRQDLTQSIQGIFHFDWSHGSLHSGLHTPAAFNSPFSRFDQWTADGQVQDSSLTLEQSLLTTGDGAYSVTGAIGFDTRLDLKCTAAPASGQSTSAEAGTLRGTLATPEFSQLGSQLEQ